MVLWKSTFASIINHDVTWAHHLKVIMINTLYYIAGKNDKMDPKTILSRINTYLFTMRILWLYYGKIYALSIYKYNFFLNTWHGKIVAIWTPSSNVYLVAFVKVKR